MYTTNQLIDAIKRNTLYPDSAIKFTPTDYIAFLNEQLRMLIQAEFVSLNEDFFLDSEDITLVANQNYYDQPEKAICWVLENAYFVGNDNIEVRLFRRTRKGEGYQSLVNQGNQPTSFWFEDNRIRVYPDIGSSATGVIRLVYQRIQNLLRLTGECGQITNVATVGANYELTVNTIPIGYASNVDIIKGKSPYSVIATNKVASVAGLVVTVSQSSFDEVPEVGDWVCQTGYTVYPHIPSEYHPYLALCASEQTMLASNDTQGLANIQNLKNIARDRMLRVSKNRAKSAPKKIIPRNYILDAQRYRRNYY